VSNAPGKKAELDKDGISLDFNKAQLDKDGISLTDSPEDQGPRGAVVEGKTGEKNARAIPSPTRKKIVISLIAGAAAICLVVGISALLIAKKPPEHAPATYQNLAVSFDASSSEGEILLDPFMVLFDPDNPRDSGVLLAQVSLQITSGTAPNISSRLFDIRSLIYRRLSANADIYSKNELAAMIRDDLKDLQVKDVAFIQYEKR
jgi:hypothetical protein